jgi:hypothetical protein
MGCMAFIAVGLTGMNLGAGSYFAAYREKNPIRVASSQGASLTFLGSMAYLSFCAMILIVPVKGYFENLIIRGYYTTTWVALPLVLVGFFSILLFLGSTIIGLRAIKRDL